MNTKTLVKRKVLVRQAMIAAIYAVLTWIHLFIHEPI